MKILVYIIVIMIIGIIVFYNYSPNLGAKINKEEIKELHNYSDGKLMNQFSVDLNINQENVKEDSGWFLKMIKPVKNREPEKPVTINKLSVTDLNNMIDNDIVWFGHSTFLLQQSGKKLMFDPMFSVRPSPVPFLIKERYNKELVIDPDLLPELDAVIISHDHYDHLDHNTILNIKDKVKEFIVPIGVEQHLIHWGVDEKKITTLEWWESTNIDNVKISLTPAQHFSGRRLEQNNTLWGGYIIEAENKKVFFSGDTGYGSHFKEIKKRFGNIDFALLECGQYNSNWADIHMLPEHTVQAASDLGVNVFMPIHWGMFTLSTHEWTDPVKKATQFAIEKNISLFTPEIGQRKNIFEKNDTESWWDL